MMKSRINSIFPNCKKEKACCKTGCNTPFVFVLPHQGVKVVLRQSQQLGKDLAFAQAVLFCI